MSYKNLFWAAAALATWLPASAAGQTVETALSIHSQVNSSIDYRVDRGGRDIWSLNPQKGDCEDFAITKRQALIDAGWNADDIKVVLVIKPTNDQKVFVGHVFLYIPSLDLVLDMPNQSPYGSDAIPSSLQSYLDGEGWQIRCFVKDVDTGERRYVSDRC